MSSYAIDANLLIYAADENSPFFTRSRAFIAACASDRLHRVHLPWPTIMAFLRIATHPRIFPTRSGSMQLVTTSAP